MKNDLTVDEYILKSGKWQEMLSELRRVILCTEVSETVKWGSPVYTFSGKNVLGLGAFKSYAAIWFFNRAFLKDNGKKLINAQEGKTKALRQWRFSSMSEIDKILIKKYITEAISNQNAGLEVKKSINKTVLIPDELKQTLSENSSLMKKFNSFSPAKQREFAEFISEAKRAETKTKRIIKISSLILDGKGLNDKYGNAKSSMKENEGIKEINCARTEGD